MSMGGTKVDMKAMGFLASFPGMEFQVHGHEAENTSGLLVLQAVVLRTSGDRKVIKAAEAQGLRVEASFDVNLPNLVLLETIGMVSPIEHLAKALTAGGLYRLPPRAAATPAI
jgi:hypothetical protein